MFTKSEDVETNIEKGTHRWFGYVEQTGKIDKANVVRYDQCELTATKLTS